MVIVATSGPEDNWVRGGIDTGSVDYDPVADETEVALHQDLADCWEETKQFHFEGGTFHAGMDYSALRAISHVGDDEIVVDGNVFVGWPCAYSLKDDDSKVPDYPDISLMSSCFEACYIECLDDGGGNPSWKTSDIPFDRNTTCSISTAMNTNSAGEPGRNSAAVEASDWWVVYIQGAFQNGLDNDNDPDSESGTFGQVDSIGGEGCLIWLETILDVVNEHAGGPHYTNHEQKVVVHEVGHQFGLTHANGKVMAQGAVPVADRYFHNADKATIRSILAP
ncbi:MAG: hypothetical protein JRI81_13550 [Deltaproteobacteria bacterium]|nr:hypothetical protein [Deltaproteobacteria bacterium]